MGKPGNAGGDMALRPISRVDDYQFPPEAWDVRGWTVRTEVGDEKVGKVEDMLLDGSGRLRYLEVDLGLMRKHVLVPLEHARAERDNETVRIEGMSKKQLEEVPEYALDPESLDEGYERRLATVYGDAVPGSGTRPLDTAADDDRELELRRMEALEGDYQVAGTDPRGWDVVTADGTKVGEVEELLMDPAEMKARYLDVSVDEKKLELEPVDRHILLPAERVRLERNKKRVVVGGLLSGDVARYPQYGGLPVRSRTARELETFFDRPGPGVGEPGRQDAEARSAGELGDSSLRHFYGPSRRTGLITGEGEVR
jgi:ribosomal 30S subunit maturation factor RimM